MNQNRGTLNIKNITLNNFDSGIGNSGTVNIEDSTISTKAESIKNSGNVIVKNSNISNINTSNVLISNAGSGTITLESGTFNSKCQVIANSSATSRVVLGIKDGVVKDNLFIESESTQYSALSNNGLLYYYDGEIKGIESISGMVTEIEDATYIQIKNESGKEIASLKPVEYIAEVTNENLAGVKFTYLQDAINACADVPNSTVKLLSNVSICDGNNVTVENTQDINFDLNGHKVLSFCNDGIIQNNGILLLEDLSTEKTASIISRGNTILKNAGTLTVDTITMNGNRSGTNTRINFMIENTGTLTVNSSNLSLADNVSYAIAVFNDAEGNVQINRRKF